MIEDKMERAYLETIREEYDAFKKEGLIGEGFSLERAIANPGFLAGCADAFEIGTMLRSLEPREIGFEETRMLNDVVSLARENKLIGFGINPLLVFHATGLFEGIITELQHLQVDVSKYVTSNPTLTGSNE